jgi:hypothetical protein
MKAVGLRFCRDDFVHVASTVNPQEGPLGRWQPVASSVVAARCERWPNVNAVDGVNLESDISDQVGGKGSVSITSQQYALVRDQYALIKRECQPRRVESRTTFQRQAIFNLEEILVSLHSGSIVRLISLHSYKRLVHKLSPDMNFDPASTDPLPPHTRTHKDTRIGQKGDI